MIEGGEESAFRTTRGVHTLLVIPAYGASSRTTRWRLRLGRASSAAERKQKLFEPGEDCSNASP
jgi:hypothetical protein